MKGQSRTTSSSVTSLRRSHGILNMLGWAILMPIGAIVARFMKQYDPIWFYSHTAIQSIGFIFGIAGIVCGFVLKNRVSTNVSKHKAIGIVVLAFGCLQVLSYLIFIPFFFPSITFLITFLFNKKNLPLVYPFTCKRQIYSTGPALLL